MEPWDGTENWNSGMLQDFLGEAAGTLILKTPYSPEVDKRKLMNLHVVLRST